MTQPNPETAPKRGETAAQFKERVLEAQRDFERQKAQEKPSSVSAKNPEPSQPQPNPAQVNAPSSVAQPPNEPAAPAITGNKEVDEWWTKKGFKTNEDLAMSYRELERELTRKNQELAQRNQMPPQAPVPPAIPNYWNQPQPSFVPNPFSWTPPVPQAPVPIPQQQSVEQLAKQYGLAPEDFEKVYAVANDLSKVTVQNELNRIMPGLVNELRGVKQETTRQREMVDLMSEPTWKNPQVQFEMHKVLQEDPSLIQRHPLPYRYAHDEALKRIARVNLGGSTFGEMPPVTAPASNGSGRPPSMAGSNGKGAEGAPSAAGSGEMTQEQFAAMPMDQKREFLRSVGALGR